MKPRLGMALALVLLVLVAIEALTVGALVLATQERLIANTRVRSMEARAAAELALRELIRDWAGQRADTLAVGTTSSRGDSTDPVTVTIERLAEAAYFARAEAWSGNSRAQVHAHAAALIRTLDPELLAADFHQAIAVHGVLLLSAGSVVSAGATESDSCAQFPNPLRLAARVPGAQSLVLEPGAALTGAVVTDSTMIPADTAVALGGATWSEVSSVADRIEIGSIALTATAIDTTCVYDAAGNWGDPLLETAPCRNYYPFIFAPHDLTVLSGAGQGILVVNGDLHLSAGVHFRGLVVARGAVTAQPGVVIEGTMRTQGSNVSTLNQAGVKLSHCALHAALQGAVLQRPIRALRESLPTF